MDRWRVVDRFDTSYYNGLDVRILLGDFVLSEVVGLSYELVENATPIFGYASYTYDKVVRGTRMIRGQFVINFKQAGYIVWMVNRYLTVASGRQLSGEERFKAAITGLRKGESNLPAIRDDIRRAVQRQVKGQSGNEVEYVVSALRAHFWGESSLPREDVPYTPLFMQSDIPLRLFIAYADPQLKDSRGVFLQRPVDTVDGRPVQTGPVTNRAELFQAEELVGVQILGYNKAIDDSGRNLLEQYQFIARDIIFWQR
jgi:hypothetical protein